MTTYYTHDNGGRAFYVTIEDDNSVEIGLLKYDETINKTVKNKFIARYLPQKIFIGKSPLNAQTKFSGGYGVWADGNSILLHIGGFKYIYIGEKMYSFESYDEITEYVSPVGNSDVPYPYAIDVSGRYYLLIEDVVLGSSEELTEYMKPKNQPEEPISQLNETDKSDCDCEYNCECNVVDYSQYNNDPYRYYYNAAQITTNKAYDNPKQPKKLFRNINEFHVGNHEYTMTYKANPESDFDRFQKFKDDDVQTYGITIVFHDGIKEVLTKETYSNLMKEYASLNGFMDLKNRVEIHMRPCDMDL